MKSGRTSGFTTGQIKQINTTIDVAYSVRCDFPQTRTARFIGQIQVSPGSFGAGGNSGFLIVATNTLFGHVFIGIAILSVVAVNPSTGVITPVVSLSGCGATGVSAFDPSTHRYFMIADDGHAGHQHLVVVDIRQGTFITNPAVFGNLLNFRFDPPHPVGLPFAVSTDGTMIFANPIGDVLAAFGVTIVGTGFAGPTTAGGSQ